ncbi:hypothetical protein CHARACLAT_011689 [Characodon lateralis]|uniref:Ubiquitin-like protein 5 n=1 Tax=Characodon lateralis TaxID=208331 RepID=A0ABU7F279_9TELE|nr:hypothetical protein [Characodon lateralis]
MSRPGLDFLLSYWLLVLRERSRKYQRGRNIFHSPAIFYRAKMIEVVCNDRLGKKVRVKCNSEDTIGDLKKLIAAQTGTRYDKIVLKKWYTIFKDHVTLGDCILKPLLSVLILQ